MFNTARVHRWLTVPGAITALVGFGKGISLYSLAIVPPALALPFLLHAAVRRSECATETALGATRAIGWLTVAWGLFCMLWSLPFGLIMEGAAIAILVAAGTRLDERRLGIVTALTGASIAAATFLLMWIGADPRLLFSGALALVLGGIVWAVEAHTAPRTTEVIPAMTIAA